MKLHLRLNLDTRHQREIRKTSHRRTSLSRQRGSSLMFHPGRGRSRHRYPIPTRRPAVRLQTAPSHHPGVEPLPAAMDNRRSVRHQDPAMEACRETSRILRPQAENRPTPRHHMWLLLHPGDRSLPLFHHCIRRQARMGQPIAVPCPLTLYRRRPQTAMVRPLLLPQGHPFHPHRIAPAITTRNHRQPLRIRRR